MIFTACSLSSLVLSSFCSLPRRTEPKSIDLRKERARREGVRLEGWGDNL
jgi:hypothetical protein